jgi:two-component system, NtrC family, response regulator HydG
MVILAIGAHPDDVEFGCFGTLARLARDDKIEILVFSSGEIAGNPTMRQEEAKCSARLINANVKILQFPDGNIVQNPDSVGITRKEVKRLNVTRIFAPFHEDTHQDHVAVSRIAMSCWKEVEEVLFYEVPSTIGYTPNTFYDISSTFVTKSKALSVYKSQLLKPYLDVDQIRGLARYRAWQCSRTGALFEAFVRFRSIDR